jgi:hypothetical protein
MNSHNENGIRLFYFSQGGKSEEGGYFPQSEPPY